MTVELLNVGVDLSELDGDHVAMGIFDEEIARQDDYETREARRLAELSEPAELSPRLQQAIQEFLGLGIPPEATYTLPGSRRQKRPNAWVILSHYGEGMGDTGPRLILTNDGLLRDKGMPITKGWGAWAQPAGSQKWGDERYSANDMRELESAVIEALSIKIRAARSR